MELIWYKPDYSSYFRTLALVWFKCRDISFDKVILMFVVGGYCGQRVEPIDVLWTVAKTGWMPTGIHHGQTAIHSYFLNLECPVNLTWMYVDCRRILKHPEETCKPPEPSRCEATVQTSAPTRSLLHSIYFSNSVLDVLQSGPDCTIVCPQIQ